MRKRHNLFLLATKLLVASCLMPAFATDYFPESDSTKKAAPANWFNLDRSSDNVQGVSTEKTYQELLSGKKSRTVVVAVIDSGVDVEHEDLKSKIWVNEDEIPNNGKDDDGNGYVDDIYGWNFLGNANGENVSHETFELTRELVRLEPKYKNASVETLSKEEQKEYEYFQKLKTDYEKEYSEAQQVLGQVLGMQQMVGQSSRLIAAYLNISEEELSIENIQQVNSPDEKIKNSVGLLNYALENNIDAEYLEEAVDYYEAHVKYHLNKDFNPRDIVGDNYADLTNRSYGNSDVTGPDAGHGTHVAGIIAADRNNDLGIKGVANDVEIMAIRAVPDGDEHDKDIANAIRYAVDNGADIINMSFGKSYSPQKAYVDEAILYAESKGVLLVHAAGNDSKNLDEDSNFPTKDFDNRKKDARNWLEIGASSWGDADNFVGTFSNYGQKSVDVFAPGVDIYSTMPGSEYKNQQGTSMAAPVVSGVAALLMSYYPELKAVQIKDIIMKSSSKFDNMKVNKPIDLPEEGEDTMIEFDKLSVSGGIINAFEAVKLAESMTMKKKKR